MSLPVCASRTQGEYFFFSDRGRGRRPRPRSVDIWIENGKALGKVGLGFVGVRFAHTGPNRGRGRRLRPSSVDIWIENGKVLGKVWLGFVCVRFAHTGPNRGRGRRPRPRSVDIWIEKGIVRSRPKASAFGLDLSQQSTDCRPQPRQQTWSRSKASTKSVDFWIEKGIVVGKVKLRSIVEKAKTVCPVKWASSQG